jgi:hypothetical protein
VVCHEISDMKSLGLISEGITDEVVINNILVGYLNTNDVDITTLTPVRDETDQNRIAEGEGGGWHAVMEYVKSSKFNEAFAFLDYIILHIDTDVCEEKHYEVPRRENGDELTVFQLIEKVRDRFRHWIGEEIFDLRRDQIIFAIAVDSTECWLLPLYFENVEAKRKKTVNCLNTLNPALNKKYGFTIAAKEQGYYDRASSAYNDGRKLLRLAGFNPSLEAFIEELDRCSLK